MSGCTNLKISIHIIQSKTECLNTLVKISILQIPNPKILWKLYPYPNQITHFSPKNLEIHIQSKTAKIYSSYYRNPVQSLKMKPVFYPYPIFMLISSERQRQRHLRMAIDLQVSFRMSSASTNGKRWGVGQFATLWPDGCNKPKDERMTNRMWPLPVLHHESWPTSLIKSLTTVR